MPGSFLDTNVILYFASGDPAKADRAEALMQSGGTISVQVLNEMVSVLRRKLGYSWEQVSTVSDTVRASFHVEPLGIKTHELGVAMAQRYGFAVYDAMIVAAALLAGCDTLWSEDMQNGLIVDGTLTVRNPFV